MPLSEHVYSVVITFKMMVWVEQWICIKFCIFEHSSAETIWMIQKAAAMGNWWLAASSGDNASPRVLLSHAEFSAKHQITQLIQPPYSQIWHPETFSFFPRLKSPLKRKRFQAIDEIQENVTGQLMVIGRTVWDPKASILKGTEVLLSCVQCFLYLILSSINVSIFHIIWLNNSGTDLLWPTKNVRIIYNN